MRQRHWPLVLYGFTGFAGLLAEQGFEKYASLLVGATASASAVVVFTYFLGFALGGLATGRLQKSGRIRQPLRVYGTLEFCVGLACILFTFLFHPVVEHIAPWMAYAASPALKYAARFVFTCLFILPVAALMGASFPLMAQVVDEHARTGGNLWARAYAANLIGACVAAFLGPYAIAPALGIRGCFWLCFAIGTFVFVASLVLEGAREPAVSIGRKDTAHGPLSTAHWLLLAASFGSGVIVFALEVLWTHLIGAVLGCSIYAFSSMLLMVLVGLLIGALKSTGALAEHKPVQYHILFLNCALLLVVQMIAWGFTPLLFNFTPPVVFRNFYAVEAYKLLITAALILPSTAALGTIFPSLLGSPVLKAEGNSYLVGYLNAANAIGCLAGALLGAFVLIPVAGSERSLKLIVVALVIFSFLFLLREHPSRAALVRLAAGALLVLAPTLVWRWDRYLLTSGLNVGFGSTRGESTPSDWTIAQKLLFFDEGTQGGFTTVIEQRATHGKETKTIKTLYTNGKFQGDDNPEGQQAAQFGFSLVPSQFVANRDRALLIGLGTAQSAAALKHLGYREIDIAEFAPGIVGAAKSYFSNINHNVLDDPAVRLDLEDGRNMLLTDRSRSYDLITIEVTSIWFSGATNLYSTEFYDLARKRLRPGGVLQQWLQLHNIGSAEVASAIASARSVFPYVSFWYYGHQGMIVASNHVQSLSGGNPIAAAQLADPAAIDRMIAAVHPILNTDHNRWIEYATPRYYADDYDWTRHNLAFLGSFRDILGK